MEIRRDVIGERFYASRNYNDLKQTYKQVGSNRAQLDWNMTLRQPRKKVLGKQEKSMSLPNLHEPKEPREPLANEHVDGKYHATTDTMGNYQNFASTVHMTNNLVRVSSTTAHTIDWQCNLRDGMHQKADVDQWKRHHTRPQQSFDMMKENCARNNEKYMASHITPQDRRIDRRTGAISIETIRDDGPIDFKRAPGCEGTHVGQWEHLINDRRYGHKARRQLGHETTLREHKKDIVNIGGSRIEDTRSDGCLVEMLGKKHWVGGVSHDPMSASPPDGDHKLYHLSRTRILPAPDEANREKRKHKQERTDADIPYTHPGKPRRANTDDVG
jgi:hypothetical protein